jgi:DNA-binding IclR family transcriptional regulator
MPKGTDKDQSSGAKVIDATGGVQSLHRAVAIMHSVARARDGLGLAELTKEVGLHSSTTFHLAKTLVTLGLLRQDSESKRYRIGPRLFGLASGALDELELLETATPFLASLAEQTGENSHIAVRAGKEVVIIGKCDGTASIRLMERIGTARPPHATAIGKILLSSLSPTDLDKLIASINLAQVTPKTITDPEQLKLAILEAGTNGIAFDDCEFDPDVRCLAAPVFDFRNQMIAAIGISAPIWRVGLNRIGEISNLVRDAAQNLSGQLGYEAKTDTINSAG